MFTTKTEIRTCPRCGSGAFSDISHCYVCGYDDIDKPQLKAFRLFVREKHKPVKTYLLPRKGLIIGESSACDVQLNNSEGVDLKIYHEDLEVFVVQLSSNGNDSLNTLEGPLKNGEKILLGTTVLWVHPSTGGKNYVFG